METLLYNGKIHTMDQGKVVEAVLIRDDIIVAVGSNQELLTQGNDPRKVDLHGRVVIPGLNDSHMHLYGFSRWFKIINLVHLNSITLIVNAVKAYIDDNKIDKGLWVQGRGWNQDYFIDDKRFLTRFDLDKISLDHPIFLGRTCGHMIVANTKALEVCGIDGDTPQVEGGDFDVHTGIFTEKAMDLIYNNIPDPDLDELKDLLVDGLTIANQYGITSIQTDDLNFLAGGNFKKMIQAFEELKAENKLTCRVYLQSLMPTLNKLQEFLDCGYHTGYGDEYLKIGPLKVLTDGSLGARTAALTNPYLDDPNTKGILTFSNKELKALVSLAHNNKMQIAVHCIGDAAIYQTLDIIEEVLKENPREDHRHGIIHCQITDEVLIERFKNLNILAYVQPIFLNYDIHIVEKRVGKKLASTSYAFKTMVDKKIALSIGTDSPVESINPFPNIYSAVTRQDLNHFPKGGWNPEQRLSVNEAIYAYTVESAYASFEDKVKGKIKSGMYADLTILEEDIFTINCNHIKDMEVYMTFLGGKIVYQKGAK